MLAEFRVGPALSADGAVNPGRTGKSGEQVVTDLHGRYFEAAYRASSFVASTQAAVTFAAGLSATAVFGLRNPAGSGKLLIINSVQAALSAAPVAAVVLLHTAQVNVLAAAPTSVTVLTEQAAMLGTAAAAVGIPFSAATLAAAPVAVRVAFSVVAAASITPPALNDDIAGQIVLYPGAIYALQASAAASAFCSIAWEEVPL